LSKIYQDKNLLYKIATKEDDESLRALLRDNSMDSWVNLSLEKEPSYFSAQNLMGESYTMVATDTQSKKQIGMYSCSYMQMHLNGTKREVAYFGELRVDKEHRNKIRVLKNGYKSLHTLLPNRDINSLYITSIANQNYKARRVLEAKLKEMPRYIPLAEMSTLIFSTSFKSKNMKLQKASKKDVTRVVNFYNKCASSYQFSPYLDELWLSDLSDAKGLNINDFYILENSNKDIEACFALWDQREFKQSVIKSYKKPLNIIRPLYNVFAKLTKRLELPKENSMLEQIYIAFLATTNSELYLELIQEAASLAQDKGAKACVFGLSSKHPNLNFLKNALKANVYKTCIEMVSLQDEVKIELNKNLLIQPEVALL
jgi:hypothetical protein